MICRWWQRGSCLKEIYNFKPLVYLILMFSTFLQYQNQNAIPFQFYYSALRTGLLSYHDPSQCGTVDSLTFAKYLQAFLVSAPSLAFRTKLLKQPGCIPPHEVTDGERGGSDLH